MDYQYSMMYEWKAKGRGTTLSAKISFVLVNKEHKEKSKTWLHMYFNIDLDLDSSLTFLEKMDCRENPNVATKALHNANISNEISVRVAMTTPRMIGTMDRYT